MIGRILAVGLAALVHSGGPPAQAPALTVAGTLEALSASGSQLALATAAAGSGCSIRLVDLAHGDKPAAIRGELPCAADWDGADAAVTGLWLGAKAVFALTRDAPTIDGERRLLWSAGLPGGRLDPVDAGWSWSAGAPYHSGCAWAVVSGGGVVVSTHVPNFLGVDNGMNAVALCIGHPTTTILLSGAARDRIYLRSAWKPLATDGRRIALAHLGPVGVPTGELAVVDLHGRRLPSPHASAAVVRAATQGWLTLAGLVLRTRSTVAGPGWELDGVSAATVARNRVVYVRHGRVYVRTIRGGADRVVLTLPPRSARALLAAGSFGVALAVQSTASRTVLYRLTWRRLEGGRGLSLEAGVRRLPSPGAAWPRLRRAQ